MEINEKEKENKMKEDLINNLIQTEFIDLKEEELSKYNYEDILKESLKTINNLESTFNESKKIDNINIIENNINISSKYNDNNIKNKDINEEKNIINTIKSSSSLEEIDITSIKDIPKKYLNNPLDFVDYLEYEQPNEKINKIKSEFIIKKYEEENHTKFEILNINVDEKLNKAIFQENEFLTCIYFYEDLFITGNILGETKIFSLSDKKLLKKFICPIKSEINYKINAIDITNDGRHIFIGYSNGNISMFDIKNQKLKLLINDIIDNCECLFIKFLQKEGKSYRIIISDQKGNVFLITIKEGITRFKVVEKDLIYKNKIYPIYLIKLIEFNDKFLKRYTFLKNMKKYIIFGSLKNFEIYSLINYSKINLAFEIKYPIWIHDYAIGDITFGLGKHPQSRESLEEDDDEPQILMCSSHDNILCLYIIPIDNGELTFPVLIGHYFNINDNGNNQIIRIGFISRGAIFLIDKSNNLKILNSRKFIRGNPKLNNETLTPQNTDNYSIAELQEVYKFNSEINNQINLITPKNNYKQTYMNSIVENFENKNIGVLSNKYIYILQLINYEACLRNLQKKEKWMDMFILGIEIYKGKLTCLEGIPPNEEERKKKLREFLQQLISVYIISDDMNQKNKYNNKNNINKNSYYDNQENLKHTENKVEIIIEFCIEIEGFDFLLDKILNMYEAKGYGDLFLGKLESFILCDKMIRYEISEDLLLKLIQLYEEKKKTNILNKLLLHIDIKSLCAPGVNSKIIDLSLLPPMINIFVNGDKPNYFKPIIKMYEMYQKSKPLNINSYDKIEETKNISEIMNSKEYKGHKILWYIKKCFIKRKYPYFINNMEEKEYSKYIIDLILWLMKENIMKDLVEFDSGNYFEILNKIFEERNIEIINKYNLNKDNVKKKNRNINEQNYNYSFKDLSPLNICNYIIEQGKKIKNSQKIQLDFNLFIIRSFKNTPISKDLIIDSIIYILNTYSFVNKVPVENKIKKLILIIKNILNNKEFTENDNKKVLIYFNDHIFDEVKAFIYKKNAQYKNCLEVFLNKDSKIYNKEEKLKEYIDETLTSLQKDEQNKKIFLDFKNLILEKMVNIGEISENTMLEIIYKWFYQNKKDKQDLIEILSKNPLILYKYIEPLSKEIIIIYKEENENNLLEEDRKYITTTLGIYIQLLCQLNKKDKILKKLKECPFYPLDKCISICEEYDVKDALIYLYKLSNNFQDSLKISLQLVDEYYNSLFNNITSDIFKNKDFEEQINNFNKSISQSIEILVENQSGNNPNSMTIINEPNDSDNLWFQILNKLYNISMKYDNYFKNMSQKRKKYGIIFEEALSDNIKDVLEKMSFYVGVRRILDEVSQKNKEAGYKEFKPILLKIFETYDNQSFILNSVARLLLNLFFENIKSFKIENMKGKNFQLIKCNVCNENFSKSMNSDGKKILIFKCNHIMHYYCSYSEINKNVSTYACPICRKNEVENAVSNLTLMGRSSAFIQNKRVEVETKTILNKYSIDIKRYKRGFNRLKNIDINFTTKNSSFIEESAKASREKYRPKY